jgi:hypothetical protein
MASAGLTRRSVDENLSIRRKVAPKTVKVTRAFSVSILRSEIYKGTNKTTTRMKRKLLVTIFFFKLKIW